MFLAMMLSLMSFGVAMADDVSTAPVPPKSENPLQSSGQIGVYSDSEGNSGGKLGIDIKANYTTDQPISGLSRGATGTISSSVAIRSDLNNYNGGVNHLDAQLVPLQIEKNRDKNSDVQLAFHWPIVTGMIKQDMHTDMRMAAVDVPLGVPHVGVSLGDDTVGIDILAKPISLVLGKIHLQNEDLPLLVRTGAEIGAHAKLGRNLGELSYKFGIDYYFGGTKQDGDARLKELTHELAFEKIGGSRVGVIYDHQQTSSEVGNVPISKSYDQQTLSVKTAF
jgi:hypothetical protein